jgi:glycerol-3-phosphate dehydrogenase
MQKYETSVLVIGGGATGNGVLRDLVMRGIQAILVEKRDLSHGTTGRYHGLLHSGGRYVVKDPPTAKECIDENRILRRIMPHCLEDTGGFFVVTPWDDPEFAPRFVQGCRQATIEVEELSTAQMLREEPLLNPRISHCFRVPDGSADSFRAAEANAASAIQHGARILNYHPVQSLLFSGGRVSGAVCRDLVKDEQVEIHAELVVNASGAWAAQITGMVGIHANIIAGKGVMLAANHRIVNTVVNRCKMPADGDILVPAHTVAVIGTTDVRVPDPDHFAIEPWEVELMLSEGEKLVPGFRSMRLVRAWAGVRPLYQETSANVTDTREVNRAFVLLDHEQRDGIPGLITVTGGKWTTYRMMAEKTVDLVCAKLGRGAPCRTHLEVLPGAEKHAAHHLGTRLGRVEKNVDYGRLVCECELATYAEVEASIQGGAQTIDDIRREHRLGMGPCQGGFCTYRAAGMLHALRPQQPAAANGALRDFLQERWKGQLAILWGQQQRQERLDELIYLDVLNVPALPGETQTPLAPDLYDPPPPASLAKSVPAAPQPPDAPRRQPTAVDAPGTEVVVVGAGLAGLVCAWQSALIGRRTRLISKGWSSLYWGAGCVDVLGRYPGDGRRVESPAEDLARLVREQPQHPYALAGLDALDQALAALQELCAAAGYPLHGSLERNLLLPTALGVFRPTCLAPQTMAAGEQGRLAGRGLLAIVGFQQFLDFFPQLAADNLASQGVEAAAYSLDLPELAPRRFVTSRVLAELFDTPAFRRSLLAQLKSRLKPASAVGFPAVLGLQFPAQVHQELQDGLGVPVFEMPLLPPSIPGIRLSRILVRAVERARCRVQEGMQVVGADLQGRQAAAVWSESAARLQAHKAEQFVLATGGILGGGVKSDDQGRMAEAVFSLPIQPHPQGEQGLSQPGPLERLAWYGPKFLTDQGHPVYRRGVAVNGGFHPLDEAGQVVVENVYVAGGALGSCDPVAERSLEGIGLATGFFIGSRLV